MLDFTALLYKIIGKRIKKLRKNAYLSQTGIPFIDSSILSKIENGHATDKNPRFINSSQLSALCNKFDITPSRLIWGNDSERMDFLKMIMAAILLNSSLDAFTPGPLPQWIEKEWNYDPSAQIQLKANINEAEQIYGFFVNSENQALYQFLKPDFDTAYEKLSNIILKQLMQDYHFSRKFLNTLVNCTNHFDQSPGNVENLLKNLITNKGSYAPFILDRGGINYPLFISAFEKYWDKVQDEYLKFFSTRLFHDELILNGLRKITNGFIHQTILSSEFIQLNEELSMLAEYTDTDAIFSSLNMRFTIISSILAPKLLNGQVDRNFIDSFSPIKDSFQENARNFFSA